MGIIKKAANVEKSRKLRNTLFAGSMIVVCVLLYSVFGNEKSDMDKDAADGADESRQTFAGADDFMASAGLEGFEFMGRSRNDMIYVLGHGADAQTLILSTYDGEVVAFVLKLPADAAVSEAKTVESVSGAGGGEDYGGEQPGHAPSSSLIIGDLEEWSGNGDTPPGEEEAAPEDRIAPESSSMRLITNLVAALDVDETLNFADMETIRICVEEARTSGKKRTKQIEHFDLTAYVDKNQLLILMNSAK